MCAEHRAIGVDEALKLILEAFSVLDSEILPIEEALGCTLAEDILSQVPVPPFDNAAMDGYAIRWQDARSVSEERPVALRVVAEVAAGDQPGASLAEGTAIRIMTGAPLPIGASAVVPFEETAQRGATVLILGAASQGQHIRKAGEDIRAGERVLVKGTRLRAQEIGTLASLGVRCVQVVRRPRVGILTTGDELVDIEEPVSPGKIRDSNHYSLQALVQTYGGVPVSLGTARDRADELTARLRAGLDAGLDLLLTSGGVSVGDYDLVKDVLHSEGEMRFWQVRMTPGRPLAFGRIGSVPLVGLPGNPVAVMVSFEQFVRPAILKMLGRAKLRKPMVNATVLEDVRNKGGRRRFVRVVISRQEADYTARVTGEQGSGILTSMVRANGLLVVPEGTELLRAGNTAQVQMLDWPEEVEV